MDLVKIGTRDSKLAIWQAQLVQAKLAVIGIQSVLTFIKTDGDENTETPISDMGSIGIFTKALDNALLEDKVDIAVHSCKDLPTQLEDNIVIGAVLKRDDPRDVLIYKKSLKWMGDFESSIHIGTGSIRRKSQWLANYPNHIVEPLRGNVGTRLMKLKRSSWHGIILSFAGLKRLGLTSENNLILLDWIVSAPGQGAIAVTCNKHKSSLLVSLEQIDHNETNAMVSLEREFLNTLEGGCSAPIGAYAKMQDSSVHFKGVICNPMGTKKLEIEKKVDRNSSKELGKSAAIELLAKGGKEIMDSIKLNAET